MHGAGGMRGGMGVWCGERTTAASIAMSPVKFSQPPRRRRGRDCRRKRGRIEASVRARALDRLASAWLDLQLLLSWLASFGHFPLF